MKRLFISGITVVLALALTTGLLGAQEPGRFEVTNVPADYQVASLLLDFPPGAWTPPHTHGGQGYLTVLEGEMTLRMAGMEHKYGVGEGWVDRADVVHELGNAGTSTARLVATYLLPRGASLTTVQQQGSQQPPPGPTTLVNVRHDPRDVPTGSLDVFQRVVAFEPGQAMSVHSHPGPLFATVVEGEIEMRLPEGVRTFRAGDTWIEPVNVAHTGSNIGGTRAVAIFVALLPRGATMTIPAQSATGSAAPAAPSPASTGQSGAAPATLPQTGEIPIGLLTLVASAFLGAGLGLRRYLR